MSSPFARLLRQLSAGFSNEHQAFENPPLYAHILVKFRPLPQLEPGSLLLDQSYAINPAAPYRLRVLKAEQRGNGLVIHNQAIRDDQRFWGAIDNAELRAQITAADLTPLEGCAYVVEETPEGFKGEVEPGCRCLVERKGATSYLVSSFELERAACEPLIAAMTLRPMSSSGAPWRGRLNLNGWRTTALNYPRTGSLSRPACW